jgi:hypothetical protein
MNSLKKYVFLQIFFSLLISVLLFLLKKKDIQYTVFFFPASSITFALVTYRKVRGLSLHLKENHFELYRKSQGFGDI